MQFTYESKRKKGLSCQNNVTINIGKEVSHSEFKRPNLNLMLIAMFSGDTAILSFHIKTEGKLWPYLSKQVLNTVTQYILGKYPVWQINMNLFVQTNPQLFLKPNLLVLMSKSN